MLIMWCLLFIVSLYLLIKASNFFISAAEKIGISFGLAPFIIGVFIVGVGTSLPELMSSIISVFIGTSEIVIGNVIGSNITNILLVLGVVVLIGGKFHISYDLMRVDLPILLGSSFLIAFMVWDTNFSNGEAFVCLACLVIYILSILNAGKYTKKDTIASASAKDWLFLLGSPVFIFFGAKYLVNAVIVIANTLSTGAEVIAQSAIAFGTSLPEVFVSIYAVREGKPEIAVGNIIGSNIFNTFGVMAIPALCGSLTIPESVIMFSLPVSVVASILCVIITIDKRVNRWEGCFLLVFYVFFIGKIFGWV